ncbi:PIN domain-containing protein [Moorena bouillonii]|nr:PIN domain-containing protein [Moorena bouillonii]
MNYDAITIDTCIFRRYDCQFESGMLVKLNQFKYTPIIILISEIVVREISEHLKNNINKTKENLENALKDCSKDLMISEEIISQVKETLLPKSNDEDLINKKIENFLDKTGSQIIYVNDYNPLDKVLTNYFEKKPPFSQKKKAEFPDALALVSLEKWAEKHNQKILAISTDKDWKDYASNSEYIDCIEKLADFLAQYQEHKNKIAIAFCKQLTQVFLAGDTENTLKEWIKENIRDEILNLDLLPTCNHSYPYCTPDSFELDINSIEIAPGKFVRLLQVQDEILSIEIIVIVYYHAYCAFFFEIWDSVDQEFITLSSQESEVDSNFKVETIIDLEGNFEDIKSDIDVVDIEIILNSDEVDFDCLHPYIG